MIAKRWEIAPSAPDALLRNYRGLSPILAQVLYNRGFTDPQAAHTFLYSRDFFALVGDPFKLKDMPQAVGRIRLAIKRQEPMIVYGDFDADGVTSTTLLMQVLRLLGANARAYIPDRVEEGYGLNSGALLRMAQKGVKLIVTVDCGIRAVQEVADGKAAGLDIIVTDHHSIGPELPAADAIVNPQQEDCAGDPHLAGVGVAFMTAYAILKAQKKNDRRRFPEQFRLSDLLDLVAMGTVADIMPLNVPLNRVLVQEGLKVLNQQRRLGVRALMEASGLQRGALSATDIGFGLGPRINAAGRLESAMIAYQLLSTQRPDDAVERAQQLNTLNQKRQQLTRAAQEVIRTEIETASDVPLIFAGSDEFLPGIVGLVAGRVTEEFYRPTVVLEYGDHESRASARSIPQFHITQALDECADLLVRHGGHAMAAGFTVHNDNVPLLRERMLDLAGRALDGHVLQPTLAIDVEVDLSQLHEHLVEEMKLLEPTGHGNEAPIFLTRDLCIEEKRTVGSDNDHLKLTLSAEGAPPMDAIAFRLGERYGDLPDRVDVAYQLEMNEWQGQRRLQMNVKDIRPASVEAPL